MIWIITALASLWLNFGLLTRLLELHWISRPRRGGLFLCLLMGPIGTVGVVIFEVKPPDSEY